MTELNLLDALVARLTERFKGYELQAKNDKLQNVRVFAQYMPQPGTATTDDEEAPEIEPQGYTAEDIESNFPCVIVKLDEAVDQEGSALISTRINVRFLIGVYDEKPDCQGYRDVLNIIDVIRQDLLSLQCRVLDRRYRLLLPMKNYIIDEQSWPIYFGQIETSWETGRPVMPREIEGRMPTYGRV